MPTPLLLADIPHGVLIITCLGIVAGILIPLVGMIVGTRHAQRRQELWHETARLALEKGQPLPSPLAGEDAPGQAKTPPNDFRTGLIMLATGAGLYLFFLEFMGGWLRFIGAIPGFIGVALLLYATLQFIFTRKDPPPAARP